MNLAGVALASFEPFAAPALRVTAGARLRGTELLLEYSVAGEVDQVRWPEPASLERTDGLWARTCFEAFLRRADGGYLELNLSPSRRWASYCFDGYREGMRPADARPLALHVDAAQTHFRLRATIDLGEPLAGQTRLGLSAVIETLAGDRSYWALAHPAEKPDFHHPDSFVLELPPA